jgi:hypothetical protein
MMRVLAISPACPSITALLEPRINNPLRALQRQHLIEMFATTGIPMDGIAESRSLFDAVLVQRAVPEYIYSALTDMGVPFVQDVDDNLLARATYRLGWTAETSLLTGLRCSNVLSSPTWRLVHLLEKYSDVALERKAFIIPNAMPYPAKSRAPSQPSRLLWIQGDVAAMTTSRGAVVSAVEDFSRKHQLPLILIGRKVIDDASFTRRVAIGEVDFSALIQFLQFTPTSIGLAPLETVADQETLDFVAGKSDLKILFFDGYGHPGVFSDAPPYADSPLRTKAKVVGNSYAEWTDALEYQYCEGWRSALERSTEIGEERHIDRIARECWLPALETARLSKPVSGSSLYKAVRSFQLKDSAQRQVVPESPVPAITVALDTEVYRLEKELSDLRNSLSWKITAPLRRLARPLMERKHI